LETIIVYFGVPHVFSQFWLMNNSVNWVTLCIIMIDSLGLHFLL